MNFISNHECLRLYQQSYKYLAILYPCMSESWHYRGRNVFIGKHWSPEKKNVFTWQTRHYRAPPPSPHQKVEEHSPNFFPFQWRFLTGRRKLGVSFPLIKSHPVVRFTCRAAAVETLLSQVLSYLRLDFWLGWMWRYRSCLHPDRDWRPRAFSFCAEPCSDKSELGQISSTEWTFFFFVFFFFITSFSLSP